MEGSMRKIVQTYIVGIYGAEQWSEDQPTPFPKASRIITDHTFDIFIEAIGTVEPRDTDTFEEQQDEQTPATGRIIIQDFEHIHSSLDQEKDSDRVGRRFDRGGSTWVTVDKPIK